MVASRVGLNRIWGQPRVKLGPHCAQDMSVQLLELTCVGLGHYPGPMATLGARVEDLGTHLCCIPASVTSQKGRKTSLVIVVQ